MTEQLHHPEPAADGEAFARQVFSGHIRDVAFGQISDGTSSFSLEQGEPEVAAEAISEETAGMVSDRAFGEVSLNHLQTQALLCSAMARLFSYPSKQQAAEFSNEESLDFLESLTQQAGLLCTNSKPLMPSARAFAKEPDEERVARIRAEYTQLFFKPNAPIRLEGHIWLAPSERTQESRGLGEPAAANAYYRRFGMQAKQGIAPDSLATELDFLARLTRAEETNRQLGQASEAYTFKQARLDFLRQHVELFAMRVCAAIQAEDVNPLLQYQTALLLEVLEYCG